MGRLARYTAVLCAVAALAVTAGYVGYKYLDGLSGLDTRTIGLAAAPLTDEPEPEPESAPVSAGGEVLGGDAKITYRYYYLKDGYVDDTTEDVPYFLVGLTRTELAGKLTGWDLVEFSPKQAVFEKKLNARSTERYTVGIQNGYVTVFYDEDSDDGLLKEQTAIPVDALSADELSRLEAGIRVIGEEQLVKVLEDYGS